MNVNDSRTKIETMRYKKPDEDHPSSKARQTVSSSWGFRKSFMELVALEMNRI